MIVLNQQLSLTGVSNLSGFLLELFLLIGVFFKKLVSLF